MYPADVLAWRLLEATIWGSAGTYSGSQVHRQSVMENNYECGHPLSTVDPATLAARVSLVAETANGV